MKQPFEEEEEYWRKINKYENKFNIQKKKKKTHAEYCKQIKPEINRCRRI